MNKQTDMLALGYVTKVNKNAGVVLMMMCQRYEGDSIKVTAPVMAKATGMNRGSVQRGMQWLIDGNYICVDPESITGTLYHVNSRVVQTFCTRSHDDIGYECPFSSPISRMQEEEVSVKAPREEQRIVTRMNKLSDEEIAYAL